MKKAGAILNILLIIAVSILFVLHFDSQKEELNKKEANISNIVTSTVHSDSLISGIHMYFINQDSLYLKSNTLKSIIDGNKSKISALETSYQTAMADFQKYDNEMANKIQTVNAFERGKIENEYKRKAYDLSLLEQNTQEKLVKIQTELTKDLKSRILKAINEIKVTKNIDFVLMNSSAIDIVLPVNKKLDLTNQVALIIDKK